MWRSEWRSYVRSPEKKQLHHRHDLYRGEQIDFPPLDRAGAALSLRLFFMGMNLQRYTVFLSRRRVGIRRPQKTRVEMAQ